MYITIIDTCMIDVAILWILLCIHCLCTYQYISIQWWTNSKYAMYLFKKWSILKSYQLKHWPRVRPFYHKTALILRQNFIVRSWHPLHAYLGKYEPLYCHCIVLLKGKIFTIFMLYLFMFVTEIKVFWFLEKHACRHARLYLNIGIPV